MEEKESEYVDFYREKMNRIFDSKKSLIAESEEAKLQLNSLNKTENDFMDSLKKFENKLMSISEIKITRSDLSQNLLDLQRKNSILELQEFYMRKKLLENLPTEGSRETFFKDCTLNTNGKKLLNMSGLPTSHSSSSEIKFLSVKDHVKKLNNSGKEFSKDNICL